MKLIFILDLIYPPVCGFCDKINKNALCKKCENKLKQEEKFTVEKILEDKFEEQIYFFPYAGFVRKSILNYKFNEKPYLYKSFVKYIMKNEKFVEKLKSYDIIMPVPISKKRAKERGYNQSYLITKEIAKLTRIEHNASCLFKTKNIIEQSKLNKEQRQENIQGVYELNNKKILKGKKILLVDDIYTTGSTVKECCLVLKRANPKKLGILTIARD